MRSLISSFLLVIAVASTSWSWAFEDSYDSHALAETTIGWDSKGQKYSAEASSALKRPGTVKLSGLNSPKPLLTGQQVTPILRVSEVPAVAWFIEEAAGGTVIVWTLVEKQGPFSPPHATLVSTKT